MREITKRTPLIILVPAPKNAKSFALFSEITAKIKNITEAIIKINEISPITSSKQKSVIFIWILKSQDNNKSIITVLLLHLIIGVA